MNTRAAFSIVEALIAMLLLSLAIVGAQLLVSSMKVNVRTSSQLQVNQASQQYLEAVQGDWRVAARYGRLDDASPRPPTLPGHGWRVQACDVNLTDGTCSAPAELTPTGTASYTADAGTRLVRLTVRYTRNTDGRHTTVSTEVARP